MDVDPFYFDFTFNEYIASPVSYLLLDKDLSVISKLNTKVNLE